VCAGAAATVAIGTCASFGGLPAAAPNPTGALSVGDAVPGLQNLINMPACPANGENLAALIVYYVTFGRLPELDDMRRPLYAYGKLIHDACEKRGHYDAGQYAQEWGDEGHRKGYCLYKMGCRGPVTYNACGVTRWNNGVSFPIQSGHGCIGCSEAKFWDNGPFYQHLASFPGFGIETTADTVGAVAAGVTAVGIAAHAVSTNIRKRKLISESIERDRVRVQKPAEGKQDTKE